VDHVGKIGQLLISLELRGNFSDNPANPDLLR